ncbi:MAG: UvrD-helicase domain-containing protein [Methanoregula sp.]|nr:MAG: UvrD-helicase domain-containing protein [Methanoregula sp.]
MPATGRQNEAITEHDRSMVVTAGAGTGKTYVLVQKYVNLIETRGVGVPEILALTFTDKAAAEMKERIRKEISRRSGPLWEKAADDFMVAPVQTFHSFCAQILREFPLETGLDPGFAVLDEDLMARIHSRSYEELIHRAQPEPVNRATVQVLSCTDQYTLRKMLFSMYGKRDQYLRFFKALKEDESGVLAFWQEDVHRFRDAELRSLATDPQFSSDVSTLRNFAAAYEGVNDKAVQYLSGIRSSLDELSRFSDASAFCSAATEILSNRPGNVGNKKVWRGNDLDQFRRARRSLVQVLEQKEPLFRLTVDPADPLITGSLQLLHNLSFVFPRYLEIVGAKKSTHGGLDFSDLILYARELFTQHSDIVATHFARRYRYILVDEFQDTDPTQFDVVLALVGDLQPTTDCLFIVGDPKQSIYLFRDADVTRFKAAQEIIERSCMGKTVDLDTSFRSTGEVIGFANILFRSLFSSTEKPWEFPYERILTSPGRAEHHGTIELLLPRSGETSSETKRNEAEIVARRIQSLVSSRIGVYEEQADHTFMKRAARYGDIALLLEQRTNLPQYLAALTRFNIPYYVHGGTGFYGRQEIYDLYNLLAFLENEHNDVCLFGVLRSPYFGMSDAELYFLSREPGASFIEKLRRSAGRSASAGRALRLLSSWQEYAGRTGLVVLIRKILSESGVYAVYGALPQGAQILANIEKLVAIARQREEEGLYGLSDFTADLRIAMEDEEREGEAPLDALSEHAVNIMTVHAAKGLEFPIIVVPDMGVSFRDRPENIMIGDDPRLVGVKVPDPDDGYAPAESPVLTALREIQRQKERAEKKRLLYVALTRARDHLIMSGVLPEEPQASLAFARTRIEWICSAFNITPDAITAGGITLDPGEGFRPVHLKIITDPAAIPAETVEAKPSLITVPADCAGMTGGRVRIEYIPEPDSHRVYTVSELEKIAGVPVPDHRPVVAKYLPNVNGTLKGTIIHEVLRGRDAATVLKEYGEYSEKHVRQCEDIVAKFRSSDLMKRVKREFCELPFEVTVDGKWVTGKIDRLCELSEGSWIVIDYKSEPVLPDEYASVAKEYEVSMAIYCEAARQIMKKAEISGYFFFIETGDFSGPRFRKSKSG